MEYWRGQMNWPIDKGWKCQTCEQNEGLEWGLVHAQCRCNVCHTEYYMRADDEERTLLTTPKCMLKDDYKAPVKQVWDKYHVTMSEMTDEMIDEFKQ